MIFALYGASSNQIDNSYITATEQLGEAMGKRGHSMVYGGGANGLMGAAARGVKKGGGSIVGIAPSFFNVDGALFEDCDEFIFPDTMRERKRMMDEKSEGFIIVPGGIGTFDEFFEIFTLRQLGRHNKPIVIYNTNGFYDPIIDMLKVCVDKGFITDGALGLFEVFTDANELLDYMENYEPKEYTFSALKNIQDLKK